MGSDKVFHLDHSSQALLGCISPLPECSFGHQATSTRLYTCTEQWGTVGLDSPQFTSRPWTELCVRKPDTRLTVKPLQVYWRAWFCPHPRVGFRVRPWLSNSAASLSQVTSRPWTEFPTLHPSGILQCSDYLRKVPNWSWDCEHTSDQDSK